MGYTSWKIVLVYLGIQGIGLVVGSSSTNPSLTVFSTSPTAVTQSRANSTSSSYISKTTAVKKSTASSTSSSSISKTTTVIHESTTNLPSSFIFTNAIIQSNGYLTVIHESTTNLPSSFIFTTTAVIQSTANSTSSSFISKTTASSMNTANLIYSNLSQTMINSIMVTTVTLKSTSTPFVTSVASTSKTIPTATSKPENDSEPKLSLYVWEIVGYASGAFAFLLFIVIGILCCHIKSLRRKIKSLQSYSIPIKENGLWIDNQDIPLWQKRASTHNGEGSQGVKESKAT